MRFLGSVLLLLLVCSTSSTHAQTIALKDTVYHVSEIVIKGDRPTDIDRLRNRPAFISIVPLDESTRRMRSTAEYLAETVGFHVRSAGGYGAFSTASVRGSSSMQVSVFLDGVPLNQAHAGLIDLSDLPLASLARIEVYRGSGAFDLSGSNVGGIINLVTREIGAKHSGEISASYGSLSTQKYTARYSLSPGVWDLLAIGSSLSTDGDFTFLDDNGTPLNPDDDEYTSRINNHLEERELFLKLSRPIGQSTIHLTNQFYHRRQGLPGYGATQSPTEALRRSYDLCHLSWRRSNPFNLPLRLETGIFGLYQKDEFQDRRPKQGTAKPDVASEVFSLGGDLRYEIPLRRLRQSLRGMIEFRRESFRSEETYRETIDHGRQSRQTLIATLESAIELWPGRLRVVPHGRYERFEDEMHAVPGGTYLSSFLRSLSDTSLVHERGLFSIGAVGTISEGFTLRANYGRYYRVPSLMERFGYRGMVEPNPELKPELSRNRDVGFRWEGPADLWPRFSLECAYFWTDLEDLIIYLYPARHVAKAFNVDKAEIEGYEVSASLHGLGGLSLYANLTRLSAINTGPFSGRYDKYLPDRPELSVFSRLQWRVGDASLFYEFDYVGGNYWNGYNRPAPNNEGASRIRRLHNMGVTLPTPVARADLTVEAKNIGDDTVEDVLGYPMPGRTVFATLSLAL